MRIAQRSIKLQDAELIALIGTQVDDGYLVRTKDLQRIESELKKLLQRLRRIVGKRLIVDSGQIVTVTTRREGTTGDFCAGHTNLTSREKSALVFGGVHRHLRYQWLFRLGSGRAVASNW
jgi:hypothetical protein